MNEYISDHKQINSVSILTLFGRFLILILIYILTYLTGFDSYESWLLMVVLLPITITYLSAFLRFVIRYPYTVEVKKLPKRGTLLGLSLPIIVIIAYPLLLIFSAFYKEILSTEVLIRTLVIGEILNAVYVGTYLVKLFEFRD